jgi:hypothetical protein
MHRLEFNGTGRFVIVQFTDTHIADLPHNQEAFDLFDLVIQLEEPDLIVLSGDIVHPTWSEDPLAHWRAVNTYFDGKGVPWMFVHGNHDAESFDYQLIDGVLAESRLGLYEPGPAHIFGHGNYAVPIYRSRSDAVGAVAWSFDSGQGAEAVPSGYDWVKEDQIGWFRKHFATLAGADGDSITGLAFIHMPLQQHLTVWQTRPCTGHLFEKVCMQGVDTGLFHAFKENLRVVGCFVGHDHTNDYEGVLEGVTLAYGRGSGYNCYGRDGYRKGARVIELSEGVRGFKSHIRLDDGSLADRPSHEPDGTSMN